jgi:hypothetical protein
LAFELKYVLFEYFFLLILTTNDNLEMHHPL